MFDSDNDVFFCVCGKKVEKNEFCGDEACEHEYDSFRLSIDKFFELVERESIWEVFKKFEKMEMKLQIGILFELEDEPMLLFLQGLGHEKVLELLQANSDALRYRFLELLEPLLEKEVLEEFKALNDMKRDEIKEFLLYLINILIKTIQKEKQS